MAMVSLVHYLRTYWCYLWHLWIMLRWNCIRSNPGSNCLPSNIFSMELRYLECVWFFQKYESVSYCRYCFAWWWVLKTDLKRMSFFKWLELFKKGHSFNISPYSKVSFLTTRIPRVFVLSIGSTKYILMSND